jgi:DNA adenine methylase
VASSEIDVTPFLKWAGGKRWLASRIQTLVPETYNRYFEPFLGSGAAFFAIEPKRSVLSDINADLINCYVTIRDRWPMVLRLLEKHHASHCHDHYYRIRNMRFRGPVQRAAQFIYLNRTCWNGLYRVNLAGEFNVPKGTKSSVILDTDDFEWTSDLLGTSEFVCCDFEQTINRVSRNDFIFVDPPYTVRHNFNGFIKYNEKLFSWADQIRLRDALARAVQRGAKVLVTNANHPSVKELYCDFPEQIPISRMSVLSGDATYRSKVDELLIRSWLCPS